MAIGQVLSSPALGDLDDDGRLDVAVGCTDNRVYAWSTSAPYKPERIAWGMFRHDARHTGRYREEGATNVDPVGKADTAWAHVKRDALTGETTGLRANYPNPFNP